MILLSDEWLDAKNLEESEPKKFGDKEYTLYEAKQKQRQIELAMRAQREKVRLLQKGKADPDEILLNKAKYQGQLNEYSRFCRKMRLVSLRNCIIILTFSTIILFPSLIEIRFFICRDFHTILFQNLINIFHSYIPPEIFY